MPDRSNQIFNTLMLITVGKKCFFDATSTILCVHMCECGCVFWGGMGKDILSWCFQHIWKLHTVPPQIIPKEKRSGTTLSKIIGMQTQFRKQQICRKVSWSDDESHPWVNYVRGKKAVTTPGMWTAVSFARSVNYSSHYNLSQKGFLRWAASVQGNLSNV